MPNRQLSVLKIHSSRLKDQNYSINVSFHEAKLSGEIVNLANNQILRTICEVQNRIIDFDSVERLYAEKEDILQQKSSQENIRKIAEIQAQIDKILYIPEYVVVVIDHNAHYNYIFQNGVRINGKMFRRFSCSAAQARKSNVVLMDTDILENVRVILNNNRDQAKAFSPSKFNAYFGLYGSATKLVSEPKFIVVKDFENQHKVKVNHVTETEWEEDDIVSEKEVELEFNRTDGMGLISPRLSQRWANELGLDYIPSQWCVRQSFIKGMLCTFPIHEFCEEINHGNFLVDTIYKDSDGNPIKADLRDYDVILSESQFKLWDSYPSIDFYIESCRENHLYWGVSQYTPKEASNILKLNYQFIQTLNLNENDIKELCADFIKWINGVSFEDHAYMLLFLIGTSMTKESAYEFMRSSDAYWIKSLILYPEMVNDKFVRGKIKDLVRTKMRNACLGEIFTNGNFQVLVSDPYGFMQHVCGLPVTGLLKPGESYSNYWNERGIKEVDAMRSPLTYRSEHIHLSLVKNDQTEKWYRYCKLGIILNYYGHEAMMAAGADFDFDILATSSNPIMLKGRYKDELPVYYVPPKPQKIIFSEKDLYNADCFSFGSIIGQITNKSSNAYALLPNLIRDYGEQSDEVKLTVSRLQQCCKAQSCQIDKAKIGREVKGIPDIWNTKQVIKEEDSQETITQKTLLNRCLLNKHPYFFIYRYKDTKAKYKKHIENYNTTCFVKFGMTVNELLKKKERTEEEQSFIQKFYVYMPVVVSDSPMNMLCRYIEHQNICILKKSREETSTDIVQTYRNHRVVESANIKTAVIKTLKEHLKGISGTCHAQSHIQDGKYDDTAASSYDGYLEYIRNSLTRITSNIYEITNYLVDYYYINNPKSNKSILWDMLGKYIYKNIKENLGLTHAYVPVKKAGGKIRYLGDNYEMEPIPLEEIKR